MDDPNNAGIYKLNTICNDDPDIIPLLNTPAPCAFERDEHGAVSYTHLHAIVEALAKKLEELLAGRRIFRPTNGGQIGS